MSSLSSAAAIAHYLQKTSTSTPTPPASPANKTEPAPVAVGFALQEHAGDKAFVPWSRLPPSAKDFPYASFGGIAEGHYTEF